MVPTLDRNHRFTSASRQRVGLRLLGAVAVALIAAQPMVGQTASTWQSSPPLTKFMDEMRAPGEIPVAASDRKVAWGKTIATHYTIDINQYTDTLHSGFSPTLLWGYHPTLTAFGAFPQKHLGGIIVAQRGIPVQITFRNNLPNAHILPVDSTIMGANPKDVSILGTGTVVTQNRTATHLHGGTVPWFSDGGPFGFFDAAGNKGVSFVNNEVLRPAEFRAKTIPANEAEYYYPNEQSARLMWYHDHAMGITRLNAYAGIASAYIIRDAFEAGLVAKGLPQFVEKGGRELPLIFQDKIFQNGNSVAPALPFPGAAVGVGNLWYPYEYDLNRWAQGPFTKPLPPTSVVAEAYGDTMLVNGTAFPKSTVDPRRYRFRILNACQARVLNLQLYEDNGAGIPDFTKPGPDWTVIGTEGGFLAKAVTVPSGIALTTSKDPNGRFVPDPANPGGSLIVAGGERLDVVVDFNGQAGKKYILFNDAPGPYPTGDFLNDYYKTDGTGPDTSILMRFEVKADASTISVDLPWAITSTTNLAGDPLAKIDPPLAGPAPAAAANTLSWATATTDALPIPTRKGIVVRQLTLNETFDAQGRLIQMLGTNVATTTGDFSRPYFDPATKATRALSKATEVPKDGSTEVWQIVNLTGDTHPIHFHLTNAQILSRQTVDTNVYLELPSNAAAGTPGIIPVGTAANLAAALWGTPRGPEATEVGWKETIKMHPGEVTTVIMKFQLPKVPFAVPESPRTSGHEYVWHCHILEHEEHDMMRTLVVKP